MNVIRNLKIKWYQFGKEMAFKNEKMDLEQIYQGMIKDIEDNWLNIELYETKSGFFNQLKEKFFEAYYLNS